MGERPEDDPSPGIGQDAHIPGARDRDVEHPSGFEHEAGVSPALLAGENRVLEAGDEHHLGGQTLGAVHRHHLDALGHEFGGDLRAPQAFGNGLQDAPPVFVAVGAEVAMRFSQCDRDRKVVEQGAQLTRRALLAAELVYEMAEVVKVVSKRILGVPTCDVRADVGGGRDRCPCPTETRPSGTVS